jgi:hypothetical protein
MTNADRVPVFSGGCCSEPYQRQANAARQDHESTSSADWGGLPLQGERAPMFSPG